MIENELPTKEEISTLIESDEYLSLIIRGHQALDKALTAVIAEALAEPHAVEIGRLTFPPKVDLAVSLGALEQESRPSFLEFNRRRNAFAHDSASVFGKIESIHLWNTLSSRQSWVMGDLFDRNEPGELLRGVFVTLFYELEGVLNRLKTRKVEAEVLHEMVEEIRQKNPPHQRQVSDEFQAKITDSVAKKLQRRYPELNHQQLSGTDSLVLV